MYGEVYVPYTGIGGTNLDSGIMAAGVTGSSDGSTVEGERPLGYNISWSLPGGITNGGGGEGGEWAYLLWRPSDNPNTVTTQDLILNLQKLYPSAEFDASGNLLTEEYAMQIRETINNMVWEYADRILGNAGLEGSDYSWDNFHKYFVSCITR